MYDDGKRANGFTIVGARHHGADSACVRNRRGFDSRYGSVGSVAVTNSAMAAATLCGSRSSARLADGAS